MQQQQVAILLALLAVANAFNSPQVVRLGQVAVVELQRHAKLQSNCKNNFPVLRKSPALMSALSMSENLDSKRGAFSVSSAISVLVRFVRVLNTHNFLALDPSEAVAYRTSPRRRCDSMDLFGKWIIYLRILFNGGYFSD